MQQGKDLASIIIVSYYTGDLLWRTIESSLTQNQLLEVIIVNNGNPEFVNTELQKLAKENDKIRILTPGNIGFAKACNLGVSKSRGEYILLLNPDCVLIGNDVLTNFIKYFKDNKEAKLGICKILNPDRTIQRTCVRKLLTPLILLSEGLFLSKLPITDKFFPKINVEVENIHTAIDVEAISGAFMMMRKLDYEDVKGMDEKYFLHMEDMDLCRRISNKGGKIFYLPSVEAIHHLSTSDVASIIVEKYKVKSFIRYFNKFYDKLFSRILTPLLITRLFMLSVYNKLKAVHPKCLIRKFINCNKDTIQNNLFQNIENKEVKNKILVAGAINQIGLVLIKKLLELRYKITVLYKNSTINLPLKNVEWIQTDFTKEIYLSNIEAKTLIYTAPLWMLPNLLLQLKEIKIERLICFSSTSIYTKLNSPNLKEKNIVKQLVDAENNVIAICKERNIAYTIFRPTMIYGLGMDRNVNFISNIIKKFNFFPVIGEGKGLRQPVHAEDLAEAAVSVIDNSKTFDKSYNLGGGEKLSYKKMLERIFEYNRLKQNIINFSFLKYILFIAEKFFKLPFNSEMANRMNQDMVFDYQEATNDFQYQPREFLK
ncbi:MAG: glycosyltransferase [Alphaproteobacteria bacterium]